MLKRTALFDVHRRLGARLVEFGGWEMPVQYAGIVEEHRAVRSAAGVFDISHMGEVSVRGPGAEAWLNRVLTNDLRKLPPGRGQYTLLCNPRGGVIDDLFAYRIGEQEFLLVINASRIEADVAWLRERHAESEGVEWSDDSGILSALAVQGPRVAGFIDAVFESGADGAGMRPSEFRRNQVGGFRFDGVPVWVARTGYTGEDGFEIVAPNEAIERIWDSVLAAGRDHGIRPCGLGARDTLRTEMCLALYGHELHGDITPVEAGLEFFVGWDKEDFIGRETLVAQRRDGPPRRLVAFRMKEGNVPPPRPLYAVWDGKGAERLGEVTSGTLSPSLGVGIGMAYVPASRAVEGDAIQIEVRGRRFEAEIVRKPLYRRPAPGA